MDDATGTAVSDALRRALDDVSLTPADRAARALAESYAQSIDLGGDLSKLGPAFLACLTALGMTPAARAALTKGAPVEPARTSPLDELRRRRDERRAG